MPAIRSTLRLFAAASLGALLSLTAACGGAGGGGASKEQADAALRSAQDALAATRSDAARMAPDRLRDVESALADARGRFDRGDYGGAGDAARAAQAKVTQLSMAVIARKADLTREWTEMSSGLPTMVALLRARVDELSKSATPESDPGGRKIAAAKESLAALDRTWSEATAAVGTGNLVDAVAKATIVRDRGLELMKTLGVQNPALPAPAGPAKPPAK